ncbi:MAG: glycosyltransferase [Thermomicrobiales bacterium]
MRILFITPQLPHPTQGGAAIRNWHLIDAARNAGHTVDLLTFGLFQSHDGEVSASPPVSSDGPRMTARVRHLIRNADPDLAGRLGADALCATVRDLTARVQYDLIQVEGLEMWPSLPDTDIPLLYDAHNAETTLQQRMARQAVRDRNFPRAIYSTIQARKLGRYEGDAIRRAAATIAVSREDADALERLAPDRPVDVVPIGVDTTYYDPCAVPATPESAFDLLFTGTMDYRANADAASWLIRAVWPRVRAVKPNARLGIVGRSPSASLLRYNGHNGITVTGAVADDRVFMASAAVYVLPIRFGAGVRVKLLNAMSMACAVVATPAATAGIVAVNGTHLIAADADADVFAAAVIRLLDDPIRRRTLGKAARAHMCAVYDWAICTPALLGVYDRLEHDRA